MIYNIFLIFFQIIIVQNTARISRYIYNLRYAIPLQHRNHVYFIGYENIKYSSDMINFNDYDIYTGYLSSTTNATTPLYDGTYIIKYIKYSNLFRYLKKNLDSNQIYAIF